METAEEGKRMIQLGPAKADKGMDSCGGVWGNTNMNTILSFCRAHKVEGISDLGALKS